MHKGVKSMINSGNVTFGKVITVTSLILASLAGDALFWP